jgi:hypothetical protein
VAKVLAALLVSMTLGAVVLMALGNNPPSAGAFCLASYYRLEPVQQVITSRAPQHPHRWDSIEVHYSGTGAGNMEQLASLHGLAGPDQTNFHFCVCNGLGGPDGHIEPSERWQRQWSVVPGRTWRGTDRTIRICAIADGRATLPTDCQVKRTEALVQGLCRKFQIPSQSVYYPEYWR